MKAQLDENASALENVAHGRERIEINGQSTHVIGYLQNFLFSPERARAPIKSLSGGERSRLLLARLFSQPANVLVLDEIIFGPTGTDRPIVAKEPVAVEFDELVEDQLEVVGRHRPVGMPGHFDRLPRLEVCVGPLSQVGQLSLQPPDFIAGLRVLVDNAAELFKPGFQFVDRPLER